MKLKTISKLIVLTAVICVLPAAFAFAEGFTIPKLNFLQPATTPEETTFTLQMLLVLVVLSLAPAIVLMMTSFARIAIVLAFLKRAIGFNQIPNQIIIALALFVTAMVMLPVWNAIHQKAYQPYVAQKITQDEALKEAGEPIRDFMLRQTREKDIALCVHFSKQEKPNSPEDISLGVLVPAFMLSELKTAFIYGFLIYVPFLIIDVVVAAVLVAMGMLVVPPMMISIPLKVLLFVLVDGWYLVVRSLIGSF